VAGTEPNKTLVVVDEAGADVLVPNVPKVDAAVVAVFVKGAADTPPRLLKRFVLGAVPAGLENLMAGASVGLLNKVVVDAASAALAGKSDSAGAPEAAGAVDKPLKIDEAAALGAVDGSIRSLASSFLGR